ncbi:GyrI-like domain-containing protein [Rhodobacteraceae bacterium N5(2021)]|uniref:GyrI-like domain-containing protein n=1 Tax=Gymnodinialimonas phycosphaerae TaxID=2841589 RepID=A0A975TW61_9RHOB|nr:GyrI-like domain-containing protein [Gymnodinialimonas phycosphaerae]MBY4895260.1 GyrI-like domain-containing protein [Gymnodinialimonas phycosphaerae]
MEITRKTLPAQPYLYVDRECPFGPEIADAMGSAFGELFAFVGQAGVSPMSMPMAIYTEMDPKIMRFRGAVAVSTEDAEKATGTVKSDTLPGGDVMHVTHTGPYDQLRQTHETLLAHMEAEGIKGTMPTWEHYIDDPGDTAPEDLRTEIYYKIG